jgi:hypothetical protein
MEMNKRFKVAPCVSESDLAKDICQMKTLESKQKKFLSSHTHEHTLRKQDENEEIIVVDDDNRVFVEQAKEVLALESTLSWSEMILKFGASCVQDALALRHAKKVVERRESSHESCANIMTEGTEGFHALINAEVRLLKRGYQKRVVPLL